MSFLLWAGGKTQVMEHLVPHIPVHIRNYVEPFLGGGSVLLHVLHLAEAGHMSISGTILCADINPSLILCHQMVKEVPEPVILAYEALCQAYEDAWDAQDCKKKYCVCLCKQCYYYAVRTLFNVNVQHWQTRYKLETCTPFSTNPTTQQTRIDIAAQFLFLNATCYRGLYRESKMGVFNGCYWNRRPILIKSGKIREASRLYRKYNVQFRCCSYKEALPVSVDADDFVVLDSPYVPIRHGDHTCELYHKVAFTEEDAEILLEWMETHRSQGGILYTNHATEEILGVLMGHDPPWPVVKTYDTRRGLKYAGTADVACELLVSNVTATPSSPPSL